MITTIPIVLMADKNYVIPTSVMLGSLYLNKKPDTDYNITILADNMDEETTSIFESQSNSKFNIKVLNIDNPYKNYVNNNPNMSCTTFLKFEIPSILKDFEKVIYIDTDTIILQDLSELYSIDLKETYAGVVLDYYLMKNNDHKALGLNNYFNAGVMLLNNKKIREDFDKSIFGETYIQNDERFMHHDQDVFNYIFKDNITIIPSKYNFMVANCYYQQNVIRKFYNVIENDSPVIIHYTSRLKPWKYKNVLYGKEWLYYKSESIVKNEILNLKQCTLLKIYFYLRGKLNLDFIDKKIKEIVRTKQ